MRKNGRYEIRFDTEDERDRAFALLLDRRMDLGVRGVIERCDELGKEIRTVIDELESSEDEGKSE